MILHVTLSTLSGLSSQRCDTAHAPGLPELPHVAPLHFLANLELGRRDMHNCSSHNHPKLSTVSVTATDSCRNHLLSVATFHLPAETSDGTSDGSRKKQCPDDSFLRLWRAVVTSTTTGTCMYFSDSPTVFRLPALLWCPGC